jgi:heme/copper-type cytochrome/quinol oxidase subunit 2
MTFCADLLEITSKKMELSFDSNLYSIDNGIFRLLEVDNRLILPRNTHIRFVITSNDVLHSWSIPSLGIKVDACPGRLNEVSAVVYRNSVFYGQCSEICGVLHGFMPIVIQTVNYLDFLKLQYLIVICSHYNA